jgi:hypothetical protein
VFSGEAMSATGNKSGHFNVEIKIARTVRNIQIGGLI